jgi:hypothetical protein
MKKTFLVVTAVISLVSFTLIACTGTSAKSDESVIISQDSLIKRGSYLVNTIGCDDCHSPKKFTPTGFEIDMEHRFAGHLANSPLGKPNTTVMKDGYMLFALDLTSAVGPWGQSYSANISSDETGIGNWTEEQFFRAIREGKSKGLKESRPLLPPMPWFIYKNMSDIDLKAIFAFLKSTKPVENRVPGPKTLDELK